MSAARRAWEPRSVRAGAWTITALSDGHFRLDGGSMWGVVPKAMWQELTPAAEDNTIRLAVRPFLAQRDGVCAVIEVGLGERWEPKWRGIYHIEQDQTLTSTLAACGVAPGDVTHVVASHCHFDHIGAQIVERDGALVPQFANARHFAPAIEIEMARHADHARRASYRAEDVEPLLERGMLAPLEGTSEVLPGLVVHVLGGHSDGVSVVTLEDAGETAIFWSDVVPTTHHVQPPYIMAYDIDVVRSFEVRSEWLARAAEGGWMGLFYHDESHAFGRVRRDGKRYAVDVVEGAPAA